jgi:adenine deaminase
MRLPPRLRLSHARRRELVAAASGEVPADLAIIGGRVLNVFTGTVARADVAIAAGRIAAVGELPGSARVTLEVDGRVIVPGLIDPHCHLDLLCTPSAYAAAAVTHGTTAVVADLYGLTRFLSDAELHPVLDALGTGPMKLLWGLRPALAAGGADDLPEHSLERLAGLLGYPGVAGAGELTAWPALLAGDPRLERFVTELIDAGLRVDGHAPGASRRTLGRLLASGVVSDHEAISGEELAHRVELGLWTMVRHSSLRPDGDELGRAIVERALPLGRLMLTADGLMPGDVDRWHVDEVVRRLVRQGVDPIAAVTMATLHPAEYLGLDAHLGSVAVGRCADLVVVDALEAFKPDCVICDGRVLDGVRRVEDGIDWAAMRLPMVTAPLDAETLVAVCRSGPAFRLHGVFARLDEGAVADDPERAYIALVTRDGTAVTGGTIDTFTCRAVASSVTGAIDLLLIGRDPEAMIDAYRRVVEMGGGMACPGDELSMPVLGSHSDEPVAALGASLSRFVSAAGVPDTPVPFPSRTTFLTLPALPGICLTADGVVEVRSGAVLSSPVVLSPRGARTQSLVEEVRT